MADDNKTLAPCCNCNCGMLLEALLSAMRDQRRAKQGEIAALERLEKQLLQLRDAALDK